MVIRSRYISRRGAEVGNRPAAQRAGGRAHMEVGLERRRGREGTQNRVRFTISFLFFCQLLVPPNTMRIENEAAFTGRGTWNGPD